MEFDNLDGFLCEKGDKIFDTSNRILKYGDGLFETLKIVDGKVLFWEDHWLRLKTGMEYLGLDFTGKDKSFWEKEIEKVIVKNFYKHAKIRLSVFRNSPGLYTPMSNRVGYLIDGMRYDSSNYSFNENGIELGVFTKDYKATSPISKFKTSSALLYVLAGIDKKKQKLDDLVLLNDKGNVCEAISSNVFMVVNDKIITPSLSEGCIDGVIRKQIIKSIQQKQLDFEEGAITLDELKAADEIFLTNSIVGVQRVSNFQGKQLADKYSSQFQSYLDFLLQ